MDCILYRRMEQLSVCLHAGSPDRTALRTVEHAIMDGRSIGCASDDPVERIDLPNKVPLPQSTNCGIAAHGADFRKVERNEARPRTHPRSSAGRFDPGMAAADYKNVKIVHCERALTFEPLRVKAVFHVKHAVSTTCRYRTVRTRHRASLPWNRGRPNDRARILPVADSQRRSTVPIGYRPGRGRQRPPTRIASVGG